MRMTVVTSLVIGIMMSTSSCHPPAKLVDVTLQPNIQYAAEHSGGDAATSACVVSSCPTPSSDYLFCHPPVNLPFGLQTLMVGYVNHYDAGTAPCACWAWKDCAWRTFFKFDLSKLPSKKVVAATLHVDFGEFNKCQGGICSNFGSCETKLYSANADVDPAKYDYNLPGDYWTTFQLSKGSWDLEMGTEVAKWASSSIPNHGLFLVGIENFGIKNNDMCWVHVNDISLKVTVNTN